MVKLYNDQFFFLAYSELFCALVPSTKHQAPVASLSKRIRAPMLLDKLFYKGMLIKKLTWAKIPMVIINTHLLANFAGDWERNGMYARVEQKQLGQLAETVRTQPAESLIIVVGDFNIPRGSNLYHDFLANSGLIDPLAGDTQPTNRLPPGVPS